MNRIQDESIRSNEKDLDVDLGDIFSNSAETSLQNGKKSRIENLSAIAERLIAEHKVAVIPGPAFGMTDGCYFRVAYGALQKETVAEGIRRPIRGLRAILG